MTTTANNLPTIRSYGRYSSDNYGAHSLLVRMPGIDVYFSYETCVAFSTPQTGLVVRRNDWGPTTGKHLNWIDGGNGAKKDRLKGEDFERKFDEVLQALRLNKVEV
jgi:hypothetical protein